MLNYITSTEVAKMLSCSPSAARKWLKRKGVMPLLLGPGRGLGIRWNLVEVEAAINDSIEQKPKQEDATSSRRPPLAKRPLVGRSLAEQLALIKG